MKGIEMKKELSPKQREELLTALKARFEKNMNRQFLSIGFQLCLHFSPLKTFMVTQ